jgi:hypothetical protein
VLGVVATARGLDGEHALRLNAELVVGSIAVQGTQLVVRDSLCLDGLRDDALLRLIDAIAAEAGRLRRVLVPRAPCPFAEMY